MELGKVNGFPQGVQTEMLPNGAKFEQAVKEISNVVSSVSNLNVSSANGKNNLTNGINKTGFSVPQLDDSEEEEINLDDLERLVALLTAESDKEQIENTLKLMSKVNEKLKAAKDRTLSSIKEAVKKAQENEKAAKAKKAWGIFGAILSTIAAIVVTVVTGGAAAGFAIAGAVLAWTSTILDLTKASKAICNKIANGIKNDNPDMSRAKAQTIASGIYGGIFLVLGLGCSIGGAFAGGAAELTKIGKEIGEVAVKAIQTKMFIAQTATTIVGAIVNGVSTAFNYRAGMAQADVIESKAPQLELQKAIEEFQKLLEEIFEKLNNVYLALVHILEKKAETQNTILNATQEMA